MVKSPRLLSFAENKFTRRKSPMKAVAYLRCLPITDAESLVDIDLPAPVASGRDLLVRVRAVSGIVIAIAAHLFVTF